MSVIIRPFLFANNPAFFFLTASSNMFFNDWFIGPIFMFFDDLGLKFLQLA